jgi:hypothetical protein
MSKHLQEYIFYYIKSNINLYDFGDIDFFYTRYISSIPCVETEEEAVCILSKENHQEIMNKINLKGDYCSITPKMLVNRYWVIIGREALDNQMFMDYLYKYKRGLVVDYVLDCIIKRILDKNKMDVDTLFDKLKI